MLVLNSVYTLIGLDLVKTHHYVYTVQNIMLMICSVMCSSQIVHRGGFCQFPFRCIYYYGSNKRKGNWQNAPLCSVTKINSADITSDWGNIILRPSALIQEIKPTKEVFIQQYLALSCTHSALYQKTKLNENDNM